MKTLKIVFQNECFTNISNIGGFAETPKFFCHPNTDMDATNLMEAEKDCLNDQSCDMFYRVCNSSRFRKCNNSAKAEYEEPSTCGDIIGPSSLYKRGNMYKTY